jgi:hypothetical protein
MYPRYTLGGKFFGRRVNCERVPLLPAGAVSRMLGDPRRIPYLLIWRSEYDGEIKEAVRVIRLGPPPYLPEADEIEVKRTDGSVFHIRVLKRPMPRNGGQVILLACPCCCVLRHALYGWRPGGQFTTSAVTSNWQCRRCAELRYASEGGALISVGRGAISRLLNINFGPLRSDRPEPWYPYVFSSPSDAAAAGFCTSSDGSRSQN